MSNDDQIKPKILIADDSKLIRASFVKYLSEEFDIQQAKDGVEALAMLEQDGDFSLLFTDLSMPNMDGYELLDKVRNSDNESLRDMPVIVVTGKEDAEKDKERMLGLGATDLISKPFHSAELVSRARGYATLRKKVKTLEKKIPVDPVTGLATREYFLEQGSKHLALAQRHKFKLTVARFSVINLQELKQEFGEALANKMMTVVAKSLHDNIRTEDAASYFGDGQFALLLPGTDPQATVHIWARLRHRIANFELKVGDRKAAINFATSVSTQEIDEHVQDFGQLLQQAEVGLQSAPAKASATSEVSSESAQAQEHAVEVVSVDVLLKQIADRQIPEAGQMSQAMHRLLPLLHVANKQLKLGMDKALQDLIAHFASGKRAQ